MGPESSHAGSDSRPRVIITRSVDENRSLRAELGRLGVDAVEIPLVEVLTPGDDGRALAAAVDRLADYRWVVLTSVNGVRALAAALGDRPWPPAVDVAAVGPTTEAAARAAGMTVALVPPDATARSLVEAFAAASRPGDRVLAPLAELAGSTVVDGLTAKGYQVDRVDAYRTAAPAPSESADPAPDLEAARAVAFFSPSAVDRFVDRFVDGHPRGSAPPVVVCIGPVTAGRARRRGLSGVITASPHTEAGVVASIERALTTTDGG